MTYTLNHVLERYPQLKSIANTLEAARDLMVKKAQEGKLFLVAGNGGSSADADHIVGELMKSFVRKRPIEDAIARQLSEIGGDAGSRIASNLEGAVQAICLSSHHALSTAFMNDVDPSLVYAQQVYGYGNPGDLFIGISTSGNAQNVLNAALVARAKGLSVLGLTGESGGALTEHCDVCIQVPERETFKVQELHLPIYHWLCIEIEAALWS
jgi:D-sedoheptulose 7-phosphate isomerase